MTDGAADAGLKSTPEKIPGAVAGFVYKGTIIFLGLAILIVLVGEVLIVGLGSGVTAKTLPDGVIAIASASVGALAGILAPSPVA
jgi:hypothetical protein